jgi:hypothetical protein
MGREVEIAIAFASSYGQLVCRADVEMIVDLFTE